MSLKDIAQAIAKNVGIEIPNSASGDDPDAVKLVQFINETGDELMRRVDWSCLRKTVSIPGSGTPAPANLPADYSRLIKGYAIKVNGTPVRGGLTGDEWNSLTPAAGIPRYFQRIGDQIAFYPYPASGVSVSVTYQSKNWVKGGKPEMSADTDEPCIPERLLEMGGVWRFKRHIGADYSDYLSEYEAAIEDMAGFDDAVRIP